ncbi:MAG: monovalent cation/H(+) antiporter subunit G [Pseudomonadota bacterium]
MSGYLGGILVLVGGIFAIIASLGVIRLPDVLTRMHASTKAGTLASSLILVAVAIYFWDLSTTTKVAAAVIFLLLTAPLAAHMIGRASMHRDQDGETPTGPPPIRE